MGTFLVTGAAGFIGSHLCEELLARGHRVRALDCFRDYYAPALKRAHLAGLLDLPGFELIEQDLARAALDPLLEGCDGVYHLAAQAGVRSSWGPEFESYTRDNVLATQRLFEACRRPAAPRVVYASSSSIYGDAEALPTSEQAIPRPVSPYGISKLTVEHLARVYGGSFGLDLVGLRYFTVYGPRQRPDMAFHRFLRAALEGREIRVFGTGAQTRDFTFIRDAVEATMAAMDRGRPGALYNIGGGERTSLARTLEILEGHLGEPIRRRQLEAQVGDVGHTSADTSLARAELGYRPRVGMEEGLGRMTAWFRERWELIRSTPAF